MTYLDNLDVTLRESSDEAFERDVRTVQRDLERLKRVLEGE